MSDKRPKPSKDIFLEELPTGGLYQVRIVGTIVSTSPTTIIVNDGTGQVNLALSTQQSSEFNVQEMGRFIAKIRNNGEELSGTLIGWNSISADQAKRYRRIIKLERRIPK
jgi:hypothetical protein